MDNIVLVQVVDRAQNLLDGLRSVFLGELALVANPVEQLSSSRELCDNVVLVLKRRRPISSQPVTVVPPRTASDILSTRTSRGT